MGLLYIVMPAYNEEANIEQVVRQWLRAGGDGSRLVVADSGSTDSTHEKLRALQGEEAVLYCGGWWQEPNISLYLNKDMYSMANVGSIDRKNGYFIVGRRFDGADLDYYANLWRAEFEAVDSIEVDYSRLYSYGSDKLFSIYKIH